MAHKSIIFDPEMIKQVKALAKAEQRDFSNMIRVLVGEGLKARVANDNAETRR